MADMMTFMIIMSWPLGLFWGFPVLCGISTERVCQRPALLSWRGLPGGRSGAGAPLWEVVEGQGEQEQGGHHTNEQNINNYLKFL